MSKILKILALSSSILLTPSLAAAHRVDPSVRLARVIGDRVPGKPVDCIGLSSITSSQIIEGKAIVYAVGSRLYVNEPRSGASSLHADDVLLTRTFGSQLCSIDTVRLIDRTSRFPRGFVSLGRFVPYSKPKRAT